MKKIYNTPKINSIMLTPSDIITSSQGRLDFSQEGEGDTVIWGDRTV